MSDLKDAIIIDGLVVSKFSRELFEDMARGGVTAQTVHVRCGKISHKQWQIFHNGISGLERIVT